MTMEEYLSGQSSPRDILNRENIIASAKLKVKNLSIPLEAYPELARLDGYEHPETITNIDLFAEAAYRSQHNPKTGLMFERYARNSILDQILQRVINGDEDIVVCETDMNDLKGLNDKYGEDEADKGILQYATWIRKGLENAISVSGKNIYYAVINVDGEGSDSMKIVLFGKDVYQFARKYINDTAASYTEVELKTKIEKKPENVSITGGWGFYVMRNGDAKELTDEEPDKEKSGMLYTATSQVAKDRMSGDKLFNEAILINKILEATTGGDLVQLAEEITDHSERISRIILQYYFKKQRLLKGNSS